MGTLILGFQNQPLDPLSNAMNRFTSIAAKLVLSMIVMGFACTAAWDGLVNGKLYDCTDGGSLDFWFVGDWVHHPISVPHVVHGRSMSEPDMIKAGWTVAGLRRLWWSFVTFSVVVSLLFASISWASKIEECVDRVYERVHSALPGKPEPL